MSCRMKRIVKKQETTQTTRAEKQETKVLGDRS
jgi:hypothetical protein